MSVINRLFPGNKVIVDVYNDDGVKVDTYQGADFHNVGEAIHAAYDSTDRNADDIRDYVFKVTDMTTGTHQRYRINAHGNVKLIVE